MYKHVLSFFLAISSICIADEGRLLNDDTEMEVYMANFPFDQYTIYEVPGQGMFYVDDIDDAIKNVLRVGQVWESDIVAYVDTYAKPGSTVIDIGAHIGTLTMVLANKVGSTGQVHAFEPQKKIFRELTYNVALNKLTNRIHLYRYAIGAEDAIIEMNSAAFHNEGGTGIGSGGDLAEMRTLDSFEFQNVSFIKIDVEGAEDAVIDGMVNTVKQNKPAIVIEIMGRNHGKRLRQKFGKKLGIRRQS